MSALLVLLAIGGNDYPTAYAASQRDGKPLLVLITAEWCGPCRQVIRQDMPRLLKRGHVAVLNFERDYDIVCQLLENEDHATLPYLIVYERRYPVARAVGRGAVVAGKWVARRIVGRDRIRVYLLEAK